MSSIFFTDRDLGNIFPNLLVDAGISVERHSAHFPDNATDPEWLSAIAGRGWVVLTRDKRIRHRPNELAAVEEAGIAMFALVGKAPHSELAQNFIASVSRVEAFVSRHSPPYVARIYLPDSRELKRRKPKGRIELAWAP